jgi:hypothetical protein
LHTLLQQTRTRPVRARERVSCIQRISCIRVFQHISGHTAGRRAGCALTPLQPRRRGCGYWCCCCGKCRWRWRDYEDKVRLALGGKTALRPRGRWPCLLKLRPLPIHDHG